MTSLLARTLASGTIALVMAAGAASGQVDVPVDSGSYLAARQAGFASDFTAAADYYASALRRDRDNAKLMDAALTAHLSLGEVGKGEPIAMRLREAGVTNQVTNLALYAAAAGRGDWAAVLADLDAERKVGPLYDGLLRAWALIGAGRMSDALAQFDAVAGKSATQTFGLYHKALALAAAGDFEGAAAVFEGEGGSGLNLTRRGVVAHAEILSQLDRRADARAMLEASGMLEGDPIVTDLAARIDAGGPVPFTVTTTPADGVAELHYTIATAVSGEASDGYTLLYARLVEFLRPDHLDARLLGAALLERLEQYDLATELYSAVSADDPAYPAAELGRAQALRLSGREEEAVAALTALGEAHPDLAVVHVTLGDFLRQLERFDVATAAYDRAIALTGTPEPRHWSLFFSRGITNERQDRWPEAEADFRRALELQPDQPQVLNYLGYSYVEKGQNMDEALDMIERAVAARPNSGYIVDSLAWALYKLGRYDEAIGPMERAAALEAVDPIVNDHLGDVLWAVGRFREAEFQWQRALSFDPEPEDAARIRRKLEVGLDQVLSEEGEPPLKLADDRG